MNITSVTSGSRATAPGGGSHPVTPSTSNTAGDKGTVASIQATTSKQVTQAVKQINDAFAQKGQNLYVTMAKDKASGINVVQIMDSTTHEVVAQFPSKEIVAIADAIAQNKSGSGQLMNVSA